MPNITVTGVGTFQVPAGKRLVNALEDECGIDQLHSCGGVARCTTCRVVFSAGEPPRMTKAERDVLAAKGVAGAPGLRRTSVQNPQFTPIAGYLNRWPGRPGVR